MTDDESDGDTDGDGASDAVTGPAPSPDAVHDHPELTGWRRWLLTTDHKDIGIMYLWAAVFFFVLSGAAALLFRIELLTPEMGMILPSSEAFNSLVTIHGGTMVFLVAMPALGGLANYLIPLMVGADEMAYPRLNAFGFWVIPAAGLLIWGPYLTYAAGVTGLPFQGGWTTYMPLGLAFESVGTDTWLLGVILLAIGSTVSSINFIVTAFNERDPDMGLMDIPLFVWAMEFTSVLAIIALAPLAVAFGMVFLERNVGMVFFNPGGGGDPLLYTNLFWFFGHPEVYIVLLPFLGAVSEIIPRFSGRPHFSYRGVVASFAFISILSCVVWAHHIYTTTLGAIQYAFMALTLAITVGFGALIFTWVATMWGGRIRLKTPMLFAIGMIVMLIFSGLDGIMLGSPAVDAVFHETYWVVAHFHFTLFGGSIMGFFAAMYYWYPRMTGRMYNETLGKLHFIATMAVAPIFFGLLAELGNSGMVRRYATYAYDPGFQSVHQFATAAAIVLGLAQVLFVVNVLWSMVYGPRVDEPWSDQLREMPSPEFNGLPYVPPTPANVAAANGGRPEPRADGGRLRTLLGNVTPDDESPRRGTQATDRSQTEDAGKPDAACAGGEEDGKE